MAIARKIAYNVVFNATAKVLSTVLALVAIAFITRYLGKEGFGDYSTVLAFFAFFGALADLGIYTITAREISREGADETKILGNALSIRVTISSLVLLLTPLLLMFFPYTQTVKTGILIAAAAFLFSSTYSTLNGVFQKNLAMDRVAASEVVGKIIQVGLIILAVKMDLGFDAIISAMLIAAIVNFSLVFFLVRKFATLSIRFDFTYWKEFLRHSFPLGISAIVIFLYFKMDTIMLSILKSSADVGIYNAAYKVLENITFFPAMIMGLVFPLISRTIFTDKKRFQYISNETATVFMILIVPILVGTLFLADGIIGLIGGNQFAQSANTLRILVFALSFIFFGNFFNNILIAGNMQKKLLFVLTLCAIFNISANYFIIPYFSYTGAAFVSVATEFFVVVFGIILTYKHLKYFPKLRHTKNIFFSGVAMAAYLWLLQDLNFFFLALSSAMVYILFLWITQTITIAELRSIIAPSAASIE